MHVHTTPGAKQSTHVARLPNSTKKKEKEKAITEKKREREEVLTFSLEKYSHKQKLCDLSSQSLEQEQHADPLI
jgi:hypothetical protein